MRASSWIGALLCAAVTTACGSSQSPSGSDTSTGGSSNSDTGDTVTCNNDANVVAYSAGMQQPGTQNNFIFEIVDSNPGPMAVTTEITWTLKVLDASTKQPVTGANITLKPFMPTMGHGSSQTPAVAASGDSYSISNIYLFMPGLWSFTVQATANNKADVGVFYFCIN